MACVNLTFFDRNGREGFPLAGFRFKESKGLIDEIGTSWERVPISGLGVARALSRTASCDFVLDQEPSSEHNKPATPHHTYPMSRVQTVHVCVPKSYNKPQSHEMNDQVRQVLRPGF